MAKYEAIPLGNAQTRTMAWLIGHDADIRAERRKRRSGLVLTPTPTYFNKKVKTMQEHFQFSEPIQLQTKESIREVLQLNDTLVSEFNGVAECKEYVKYRPKNSVILIIFDPYADDRNIVTDFKKESSILVIYCCVSQKRFDALFKRRIFKNHSCFFHKLRSIGNNASLQCMDLTSHHIFSYLFITELLSRIPRPADVEKDFIEFCKSKYENDANYPQYERDMQEFVADSDEIKALKWYTKSKNFFSLLINEACIGLDYRVLPKIGFFLYDIYQQLKKLHNEQLGNRLKSGLTVFRGKSVSMDELNELKAEGHYFITRNMLSASIDSNVAQAFNGKDARSDCTDQSVLLTFQLDHIESEQQPVAFIDEVSHFDQEGELLFPMGVVFRLQSYTSLEINGEHMWKFEMIRGEEEIRIEKNLNRQLPYWAETVVKGLFTPICNVQQTGPSGQENPPRDAEMHDIHAIEIAEGAATNTAHSSISFQQDLIIMLSITVISILAAITMGVGLHIASKMNSTNTELFCWTSNAVSNPSTNYQVEQLNLTCTQTLINMTIIFIIQRAYNETHAQQYQTFWNQSTNMTYTTTPTQLTYLWYSLPGMEIGKESFPHFVEAQYFYTSGSVRNTSGDTWQMWLKSIQGGTLYLDGTF